MPFLSSFGGAVSFGFGLSGVIAQGGGGGGPYNGTMYYYEGPDESDTTSTWATLAKWYKNSGHTSSATDLPSISNATVLLNNTSADLETWTAPASIDIRGKTLTLNAHEYVASPACAAAVQFDTPVTGTEGGTLVFSGHVDVVGINHPLYYSEYVMGSGVTNYYFEENVAVSNGVEGYIYTGQFTNTVAPKALFFITMKDDGQYYDVNTDSTGKVTSVELSSTGPFTDEEVDFRTGRISYNPALLGYTALTTRSSCDGVGNDLKLMIPNNTSTKPVLVLSVKDPETGSWSMSAPGPYSGYYIEHMAIGNGQDWKYHTGADGFLFNGHDVCGAV